MMEKINADLENIEKSIFVICCGLTAKITISA